MDDGDEDGMSRPSKKMRRHGGAEDELISLTKDNESVDRGDDEKATRYTIRRQDLVRVLLQSLDDLGYSKTRKILEEESGCRAESEVVSAFASLILKGEWETCLNMVDNIPFNDSTDKRLVRFRILTQRYLELLNDGELNDAMRCLRECIAPLCVVDIDNDDDAVHQTSVDNGVSTKVHSETNLSNSLHHLASLIMCTTTEDLERRAKWSGDYATSRKRLMRSLMVFVSESAVVPSARLRTLLSQSIQWQILQTPYRNANGNECFSLLRDHVCDEIVVPQRTVAVLRGHADEVWHAAFSHSGDALATASKDGMVFVWNVAKIDASEVTTKLSGHLAPVNFVAWSPDDSRIISCSEKHDIKLWCTENGTCLRSLEKHTQSISALAWAPSGTQFVSGGVDKKVVLWSTESADAVRVWSGVRVQDLALSSNDRHAIVASTDQNIHRFDLADTSKPSDVIVREKGAIVSICLAKNDRHVFVQVANEEIRVWDVLTKSMIQTFHALRCSRFVIRVALGGFQQNLVASGSEDSQVYVWYRRSGKLLHVLSGHSATVNAVSWSPNRLGVIASASDDSTVRIWGP